MLLMFWWFRVGSGFARAGPSLASLAAASCFVASALVMVSASALALAHLCCTSTSFCHAASAAATTILCRAASCSVAKVNLI